MCSGIVTNSAGMKKMNAAIWRIQNMVIAFSVVGLLQSVRFLVGDGKLAHKTTKNGIFYEKVFNIALRLNIKNSHY